MNTAQLTINADFEHSRKVSAISGILAGELGYSPPDREIIIQAALYHDLGKTEIPASILNKPGALTREEFEIVKQHTAAGYRQLMDAADALKIAAVAARDHHEKIDGSGYMGLTGGAIHPFAKLIAAADVFDALIVKRVYKDPWSLPDIKDYFRDQSGKQFDGEIVQALMSVLDKVLELYNGSFTDFVRI
ncbi:MAG: HD domain-containing protein [Oscillospiraceae bacterium]|jgi:putative nucleotidyltransferase with HDIG domain|nr:HD domain-containing protein [Oscillospiraceae bacterium]